MEQAQCQVLARLLTDKGFVGSLYHTSLASSKRNFSIAFIISSMIKTIIIHIIFMRERERDSLLRRESNQAVVIILGRVSLLMSGVSALVLIPYNPLVNINTANIGIRKGREKNG